MTDPAIDAIREARHQISHDFGNDPARLIDHYRRMQETFAGRIIHGPEADAAQRSSVLAPTETSERSERGSGRR
jgi:hypothetical protein